MSGDEEATVKFTLQWFLALFLGVATIYLLVQNAYEPGATTVTTAMVFAFAPMIAILVLRSLWVGTWTIYGYTLVFCLFLMFLTTLLH